MQGIGIGLLMLGGVALTVGTILILAPSQEDAIKTAVIDVTRPQQFSRVQWQVKPFASGYWVYLFGEVDTLGDAVDLKAELWRTLAANGLDRAVSAVTDYGLHITEINATMGAVWNSSGGGPASRPHHGPNY